MLTQQAMPVLLLSDQNTSYQLLYLLARPSQTKVSITIHKKGKTMHAFYHLVSRSFCPTAIGSKTYTLFTATAPTTMNNTTFQHRLHLVRQLSPTNDRDVYTTRKTSSWPSSKSQI